MVDTATWNAVEKAAYPLLAYRRTVLQQGSKGATVTALQKALKVTADGEFGAKTLAALKAAQVKAKLPQTGSTDVATWIAVEQRPTRWAGRWCRRARRTPDHAAATTPTTPATKPPTTAPPTPATSATTLAKTTSVSAYKGQTLRQGAKGAAVKALQKALGMSDVDGEFGSGTLGTVKAFQKAKKLPVTGVVDRRTWDAVELVAHPLLPYRTTVLRPGLDRLGGQGAAEGAEGHRGRRVRAEDGGGGEGRSEGRQDRRDRDRRHPHLGHDREAGLPGGP